VKIKNNKGFTLIELLIVVAIIAILAAIAIPQFSQYRIRGYNAAANSDLRNAKTAEEALFADYQAYGDSTGNKYTSPVTLTTQDFSSNTRFLTTSLSANVGMLAASDASGSGLRGSNYLLYTKHQQGDREFAADGNATSLYWCQGVAGSSLTTVTLPTNDSADNLSGAGDAGNCGSGKFSQL
jgi:type IV pilus assembly protein PilA